MKHKGKALSGNSKKQRFELRVGGREKDRLKGIATAKGLSMSGVLLYLLKQEPIPNISERKEKFEAVHNLSKEINYIGKNINQITIAIRQIQAGKKIEDGEFLEIVRQIERFNATRTEIGKVLKSVMEH